MKRIKIVIFLVLHATLIFAQKDFSFVFLPDLHLYPDSMVIANFDHLTSQLNGIQPDFILTGGDMIYTAKNINDKKAKLLFDFMDKEFKLFKMPVYLTMGNHENVGITKESGIDNSNPYWGKQMYEKRYHKSYYSFIYKGWKFFILDGIKILEKEKDYTSGVDSIQINWIKHELQLTDKTMPSVISIHTPLINPEGITNPRSEVISSNSKTILSLFKDHNLKIVLEGHTHRYMNLYVSGTHYISGGSTSSGTDPFDFGFILIDINKNIEDISFLKPAGNSR